MNVRASLRFVCVALSCAALLVGCGGGPRLRLVCVVDLSSSIEPDARAEAFAALLCETLHDRLTHDLVPHRLGRVGQAHGQPLDLDADPPRGGGREALLFDQLTDVACCEGPAGGGHGYRYP